MDSVVMRALRRAVGENGGHINTLIRDACLQYLGRSNTGGHINSLIVEALKDYTGSSSDHINTLIVKACQKYLGSSDLQSINSLTLAAAKQYDSAALILDYANGVYSNSTGLITKDPSDLTSFTRSGARTATGSDGTVYDYATGVRRIVPGEGLRVTAGATNAYTRSGDLSHTDWLAFRTTKTTGDAAPLAGQTYTLVTASETNANGSSAGSQSQASLAAGQYTQSIFVRAADADNGTLYLRPTDADAFADRANVWINPVTGAVLSSSGGTSFTINETGSVAVDGGYRVWVTFTTSKTMTVEPRHYIADGDGMISVTSGKQFQLWGAQFETGSVATDYIPTTSASASAGADEETFDLGLAGGVWTNLGGLDPAEGFTVLTEFNPDDLGTSGANGTISNISDDPISQHWLVGLINRASGVAQVLQRSGGVNASSLTLGAVTYGALNRLAISYAGTTMAASLNGSASVSGTAIAGFAGDTLRAGAFASNPAQFGGFIPRTTIKPGFLTNAQREALTS